MDNVASAANLVIILRQMKVNSMAVECGALNQPVFRYNIGRDHIAGRLNSVLDRGVGA
jgi:hypothetical protein